MAQKLEGRPRWHTWTKRASFGLFLAGVLGLSGHYATSPHPLLADAHLPSKASVLETEGFRKAREEKTNKEKEPTYAVRTESNTLVLEELLTGESTWSSKQNAEFLGWDATGNHFAYALDDYGPNRSRPFFCYTLGEGPQMIGDGEHLDSFIGFGDDSSAFFTSTEFMLTRDRLHWPVVKYNLTTGTPTKLDYQGAYTDLHVLQDIQKGAVFLMLLIPGLLANIGFSLYRQHAIKGCESLTSMLTPSFMMGTGLAGIFLSGTLPEGISEGHIDAQYEYAKTAAYWGIAGVGVGWLFEPLWRLKHGWGSVPRLFSRSVQFLTEGGWDSDPGLWAYEGMAYHLAKLHTTDNPNAMVHHLEQAVQLSRYESPFVPFDPTPLVTRALREHKDCNALPIRLDNQALCLLNGDLEGAYEHYKRLHELNIAPEIMYFQSRVLDSLGKHEEAYKVRNNVLGHLLRNGELLRIDQGDARHKVYGLKIPYLSGRFVVKEFDRYDGAAAYVDGRRKWNRDLAASDVPVEGIETYEVHEFNGKYYVPKDYAGRKTMEDMLRGKDKDLRFYDRLFSVRGDLAQEFTLDNIDTGALAEIAEKKFMQRMGKFVNTLPALARNSVDYLHDLHRALAPFFETLATLPVSNNFDFKLSNLFPFGWPMTYAFTLGLPDTESCDEIKATGLDASNVLYTSEHDLIGDMERFTPHIAGGRSVDETLCGWHRCALIRGGDMLGYWSEQERDYHRRFGVLERMQRIVTQTEGIRKNVVYGLFQEARDALVIAHRQRGMPGANSEVA